jgi:hypothetical protein
MEAKAGINIGVKSGAVKAKGARERDGYHKRKHGKNG